MKNKIYIIIIFFISSYVGLALASVYLYFQYEKTYLDAKLKFRGEVLNKVTEVKKIKNTDKVYNDYHYTYEISGILPFSNISNSTIVYGKEADWSVFQTDKFGFFHNTDDSYLNPNIILLGDSFGKGGFVTESYVPKNLLEKNGYKTLNLSSGGGTLVEVATYLEYAKDYEDKKVLIFFYEGNDYQDNIEEFKNSILIKYFNDLNFSQNLISKQNIIDAKITKRLNRLVLDVEDYKFDLFGVLSLKYLEIIYIKLKYKFYGKEKNQIEDKKLKKLIVKFNNYLLKKNNELIVVHIPLSTRFNNKNNFEIDNKKNQLANVMSENNIKFLDFTKYVYEKRLYEKIYRFKNEKKIFPIKKRHFNKEGYEELIAFILKNIN